MKKLFFIIFSTFILTACGDPNPLISSDGAGFFGGLWDGLTSILAFIFSIFGGDYNIYEVVNTGNFYNLGFLIGLLGAVAVFVGFIWLCILIINGIITLTSK
jgi:hypothetical protein